MSNNGFPCFNRIEFVVTILVITFWQFTVFQRKFHSPLLNQYLVSIKTDFVYGLPHELWKDLRVNFRTLGN